VSSGPRLAAAASRAIDVAERTMVVETPVPEHAIAGVRLGPNRIR
jgi:hypothetical protein